MKNVCLGILVAGLTASVYAADEPKNIVFNPGFEDAQELKADDAILVEGNKVGKIGDSATPLWAGGWIPQMGDGTEVKVVTGTPDKEVHSGAQAFWIKTGKVGTAFYQENGAAVTPTYKYSFWAKGTGSVAIRTYESDGKKLVGCPINQTFKMDSEWKKYEGTYKCKTAAAINFSFVLAVMANSEVTVDDFDCHEETQDTASAK